MMKAEHRRPLAAFVLVFAFACAVMANGLREQVVRVFVDAGAPRPLISAVVPDILLGHPLRAAPRQAPASAAAEVKVSAETETITASRPVTLTAQVSPVRAAASVPAAPVRSKRAGHPRHHAAAAKPAHLAAPSAPTHPTTLAPTKPSAPSKPT